MTNPASEQTPGPTCPECGAEAEDPGYFACGSRMQNPEAFPPYQSDRCRIASLARQLAERDAELELARADNAALLKSLNDVFAVLVHEDVQAEEEQRYGDSKFFHDKASEIETVIGHSHPGQPLLDKLKRLERVAEAAR